MFTFRFLAAEFGLEGRDNVEKAEVNEVVDAINDMQTAVVSFVVNYRLLMNNIRSSVYCHEREE